jgi:soluble cytochrome b562
LSDDEAEQVNQLLDQADALCTEGNFKDASAALAQVNGLINKKK